MGCVVESRGSYHELRRRVMSSGTFCRMRDLGFRPNHWE